MNDALLQRYLAYRLETTPFALLADTRAGLELCAGLYPRAQAKLLFVPPAAVAEVQAALRGAPIAPTVLPLGDAASIAEALRAHGVARLVYCAPVLGSNSLELLYALRAALPAEQVLAHTDLLFLFEYLYNTVQRTKLYNISAEDLLSEYFTRDTRRSRTIINQRISALEHVSLAGRSVVELGCLHCNMTNYFLSDAPASLTCVEIDFANIALCHAWRTACGHENVSLLVRDFHNLNQRCDVLLAYGVLYHSSQPLLLLEHLSTLADTILVGVHVWSDAESHPRLAMRWRDQHFEVMVTPEYKQSTGGLCPHQTYVKIEDYFKVLQDLGYSCTLIETTQRPDKRVYCEFIAKRN